MIEAIASLERAARTTDADQVSGGDTLPLLADGLWRMALDLQDQLAALSEFRHVTESRLSRIENGLLDIKLDLKRALAG